MYTMMQACKETNMSYQALKYYCNEGLVPNVKRDSNNRRVFDEHDVKWIKDLVCLKRCGMSILEMKEYLELCLQGPSTIPQRKQMLAKKQQALRDSIQELQPNATVISDGLSISRNSVAQAEGDVASWVSGLGLIG